MTLDGPLTLAEARAAILFCVFDAGRVALAAGVGAEHPPSIPAAFMARSAWRRAPQAPWLRVAGSIADATHTPSGCSTASLAWVFWSAFRDDAPIVAPAPSRRDLGAAEHEIDRSGLRDTWANCAARAAALFVELTRPTGAASFSRRS